MKPRELYNDEVDIRLIIRYLVKHRPSENHSVHYDVRGQIVTQVWPHRVPTAVYIRMKEDAELDHPATR